MNKGKSIRNQSEKDVYTPQKHNLNIQFEQVIKTESVSVLESEEGYEPLQLTKPCDYIEMRGYFGPSFFGSKFSMTVILGLQTTTNLGISQKYFCTPVLKF